MHYTEYFIERRYRNTATSYAGTSEMHYAGRLIDRRYRKLSHELHRYLRDALHRAPQY
jgi:hypothetical protein